MFATCWLEFVFSPGSVKADILVKTFQDTDESVRKRLEAEVDKAKIGNLAVDRYLYTIEQSKGMTLHYGSINLWAFLESFLTTSSDILSVVRLVDRFSVVTLFLNININEAHTTDTPCR